MEKPCVGQRFLTTRVRLPHQFRTRNDLAKMQNAGSSPAGPANDVDRRLYATGEGSLLCPRMVPRGGIEPPTLRFSVACSTN